jgi:hypothetical protein
MKTLSLDRVGGILTSRDEPFQKFQICERRNPTPSKGKSFLIQKTPEERYVSSLWPTDASGSIFEFESGGRRFVLTLSETTALIQAKEANRNE